MFRLLFKIKKTSSAISANLIEFLMLFPGENFNFLKKELSTIPGFIIVTLISDLLHSSLKDLTKPNKPCFAAE